MTVDQLSAFADEALTGLPHRRIEFDFAEAAEPLRAEFTAHGWRSTRLVWMHHGGEVPPVIGPEPAIEEVPYDAVNHLRRAWHEEDHDGTESDSFHAAVREIGLRRRVRVFTVLDDGHPVAFTQLDRGPRGAEVALVYVARDRRRPSGSAPRSPARRSSPPAAGRDRIYGSAPTTRTGRRKLCPAWLPCCRTLDGAHPGVAGGEQRLVVLPGVDVAEGSDRGRDVGQLVARRSSSFHTPLSPCRVATSPNNARENASG